MTNGKEAMRPNTVSSCATAVKAVQQVIGKPAGAESIKPDRSGNSGEPTLTSMDCDGIDDKSDPVNAEGFTSIFLGGIPSTATDDQIQVMSGTKANIVRYHRNATGHAKILVHNSDVVRVLALELTVSGQKLRVARWQSKTPSHRVPAVVTNRRQSEMAMKARQERVKSEMAMKQARQEQAMFVADLLRAQAAPRRLYSQVANTAEARMKSMETAIYGVRQLLERLTEHRQ